MDSSTPSPSGFLLVSVLALILVAPAHLNLFTWSNENLVSVPNTMPLQPHAHHFSADLDADNHLEHITLTDGTLSILRDGLTLWTSPPEWEVTQAQITDLNQDGKPEVTLLLWRDFAPWPIDRYLVYPGRINDFHDSEDRSCHVILIGWRYQSFVEIWAGSALVDPLLEFIALDLDLDGDQELVALESRYDRHGLFAHSITVWEWNGFGFSLLSRGPEGRFQTLLGVQNPGNPPRLLVHGIPRR